MGRKGGSFFKSKLIFFYQVFDRDYTLKRTKITIFLKLYAQYWEKRQILDNLKIEKFWLVAIFFLSIQGS